MKVIASGVKAVALGFRYTMVLKTDGSVWGAGQNIYGELGDGTTKEKITRFKKVFTTNATSEWTTIACLNTHTHTHTHTH